MPLYEFSCDSCGSFDRRLTFESGRLAQACPTCDRIATRVYSATYFRAERSTVEVAHANELERHKRARSGEPRLERRPVSSEPAVPAWQPLHGARGDGRV